MDSNQRKEEDIKYFNKIASEWNNSAESVLVARKLVEALEIRNDHSVLDVASGTGVLLQTFADLHITPQKYTAIDSSSSMLAELTRIFPYAQTYCADFEEDIKFETYFDFVIIYNSIPHFENLDMVFLNASRNLKDGGKFIIAHPRTRAGLREHHRRIGFDSDREPIPGDEALIALAAKYHLGHIEILDDEFFYFSSEMGNCEKKEIQSLNIKNPND